MVTSESLEKFLTSENVVKCWPQKDLKSWTSETWKVWLQKKFFFGKLRKVLTANLRKIRQDRKILHFLARLKGRNRVELLFDEPVQRGMKQRRDLWGRLGKILCCRACVLGKRSCGDRNTERACKSQGRRYFDFVGRMTQDWRKELVCKFQDGQRILSDRRSVSMCSSSWSLCWCRDENRCCINRLKTVVLKSSVLPAEAGQEKTEA